MVDARFVMDHRPCGAIGMTAGEDVLKTETATAAPATVVPRIGAFPNGGQVMPMERTVGLLLTAAPLTDASSAAKVSEHAAQPITRLCFTPPEKSGA